MSEVVELRCDRPTKSGVCHRPGEKVSVTLDGWQHSGILCQRCQRALSKILVTHGLSSLTYVRKAHRRAAYLGVSGRPFTAHDVRQWLIESDRLDPAQDKGRIATSLIDEYANNH